MRTIWAESYLVINLCADYLILLLASRLCGVPLHRARYALGAREREIISLRFGLPGGREYTQKEVADLLGISQSYISRLEKKIIERLRREMLRQMQV